MKNMHEVNPQTKLAMRRKSHAVGVPNYDYGADTPLHSMLKQQPSIKSLKAMTAIRHSVLPTIGQRSNSIESGEGRFMADS